MPATNFGPSCSCRKLGSDCTMGYEDMSVCLWEIANTHTVEALPCTCTPNHDSLTWHIDSVCRLCGQNKKKCMFHAG